MYSQVLGSGYFFYNNGNNFWKTVFQLVVRGAEAKTPLSV